MQADDQRFATGFSSPVVAGDAVIVGLLSVEEMAARENAMFRGGVVAFDLRSGKELWRYRTAERPDNGVGVWSTAPAVVGRRVYFGSGLSYFPPTKSGRTVYALEDDRGPRSARLRAVLM